MEYYILKMYKSEKEKNPNVEQGLSRFEFKYRVMAIGCLISMLICCIILFIRMFVLENETHFWVETIVCLGVALVLLWIDNKEQKEHLNKYVDSQKEKIDILDRILKEKFEITSRKKVKELIDIYQEYVDERKEEEKGRNQFILVVFSALAGVLSISFGNLEVLGMDFTSWLRIALLLLLIVSFAMIWIYSYRYIDTVRKNYEMMIKDLRQVLLMKY